MRRKEKEVCNLEVMESLLRSAQVLRLGLCDGGEPYVVPVLFGYEAGSIFIHSAREGRKMDILRKGGLVCFEVEEVGEIAQKGMPCKWTLDYASVIGWGEVRIVTQQDEVRRGLDAIMRHYGGKELYEYSESSLSKMLLIRIDIVKMTCKRSM